MSDAHYQLKEDPYSSHSVLLALLGDGRGRRLLDVGAADGFLAEILSARGWTVTAVERDPVRAEQARGKCRELIVGDVADAVAGRSDWFDAIVFGDVLEHLDDPLAILRSATAALAPGGLVLVSVPNVAHLFVRLSLLLGHFDYADRGILDRTHLRFFTRRTFLALLAQAGLEVDAFRVTPVPLPLVAPAHRHRVWLRVTHALSARASRWWPQGLAYQFVASCRLPAPSAASLRSADAERAALARA
jgi:2-polyprenyl-3-methyl-5-hydroxy-6-metoxy-1,4-benzoquinol methylase